jgi:Uri superfamily endonuclease
MGCAGTSPSTSSAVPPVAVAGAAIELTANAGTYALVLRSLAIRTAVIGQWGRLAIEPGYYIYIGSAFGPGGLRARVMRHCRAEKNRHWHIDYLRAFAAPVAVWYCDKAVRFEHSWAQQVAAMPEMKAIDGFGCSDCDCRAHLFFTTAAPKVTLFRASLPGRIVSVTL